MTDNIIASDKDAPHIRDVLDIAALTELFQGYSDITGMVTALLDLQGEVLIATNWQDSCTKFHRVSELTGARCRESDTALAGQLQQGGHYNVYRCKNGLVDVATPVIIDGRHMANMFTGQFFYDAPDMSYFSRQADEAGFDKEEYLDAIRRVPVYDHETIQKHMAFLVRLAEMVGNMGAASLKTREANRQLEIHRNNLQSLVDSRTQELQQSLSAAQAANSAKSKFLANMSHELRTPLNAVLGFSEILAAKESDPRKKQYLNSISLAGKGLLNLINSVLDLSKIESGKMPVQKVAMSVCGLLQEIASIFSRQLAEKDLAFNVDVDSTVPAAIYFDESKLRQILINLVGNALKFTEHGQVAIRVRASPASNSRWLDQLTIDIKDTGKGIKATDQQRIFNTFEQAENQDVSAYGGTGLGLALTRQLVDLLGGELTLVSSPGRGSTFSCRFAEIEQLPASALAIRNDLQPTAPLGVFAQAKVLVVDDNAINLDVMSAYLGEWGLHILQASNGKEAIEIARQHQPDLIFMDMKMPVMDGYEATRQLKAMPETRHIPVIAATASALVQEKEEIRKIADGYLSKPVQAADLIRVLCEFIPARTAQVAPAQTRLVLIVDDVEINRLMLSELVQEVGNFDLAFAASGQEAVEQTCRQARPDIILMDCEMPGMDGIQATKIIRAWEVERQLPAARIFAVSAHSLDELQEKGCGQLFDGQVQKPIGFDAVSQMLR